MIVIKEKTPGEVWLKACKKVFDSGSEVYDDDLVLKELLDLFIVVEHAWIEDELVKRYGDTHIINWMVNENFCGTKPVLNWSYSYGMRLRDYRGVNQIDKIIEKLKKKPGTKSATITTMDPENDFEDHLPCIVSLDFKIRNGKLLLTSFFRSQDVGKKIYADILSLGKIQQEISEATKVPSGPVKIFISSAHIYEADFDKVKQLLGSTSTK